MMPSASALVIGAGPAGCAAALTLARRGIDVILVDRSASPRDKVCGDALIPDALAALETLGLGDRILASAWPVREIRLYAPGGREVRLRGECRIIRRLILDDALRRAAVDAGARVMVPYKAVAPLGRGATCAGARLRHSDGTLVDVRARWTILATGASGDMLRAFAVGERIEASATAARVYLQAPAGMTNEFNFLAMSYHRELAPGYGWMFPGPDNVFNVGVAVYHDTRRRPGRRSLGAGGAARSNLRFAMARFIEHFDPARALSRAAVARTRLLGAPLRTALAGARFSRPGLLVAGEAAGTTYSLTGEGIGKALETGMLAADVVANALDASTPAEEIASTYAVRLESAFRDRFAAYERAQRYAEYPIISNLLAWRAQAGTFVRSQLEGMFNETIHPGELFSARGLARSLFR